MHNASVCHARPARARYACGHLLAGLILLLAAGPSFAEPRLQLAGASGPPAARGGDEVEMAAVEARLDRIERLSKRDPRRALIEIGAFDPAPLSERGRLRLAAARARVATFQFRMHEAIKLAESNLPRARALGDPAVLTKLLGSLARALLDTSHSAEALAAGHEALQQAELTGDAELRVESHIFLVDHAARRGDFEHAFAQLERAWQIARQDGGPGPMAAAAYTGALLAVSIDDPAAAAEGFRLAEEAFRADGDALGEADAARELSALLVGDGRYTEAQERLRRAMASYRALDDEFGVVSGTALMARVESALGDGDRAFRLNRQALDALRRADLAEARAAVLIDRMQLILAHGRTSGLPEVIEEARVLLVRSEEMHLRLRFLAVAAESYAALGRYREAHAALAELLPLHKRFDDRRLSRQLAAQRGRLESERLATDLERARRDGHTHRVALAQAERNARIQTAFGLLSVFLALAATVALVRVARRSRRDATLARTDYLTGAQNRRRIAELGQHLLTAARARGEAFCVLLLDLDRFKSINDDYGHPAGDRALRAVADELKRHLRRGDELGRYGGEEFAVLLPATTAERARAIAERLRTAIAALGPESLGLERPLSVSVGVACLRDELDFPALIARADRALYLAKSAGRDRVADADADDPPRTAEGPAFAPRCSRDRIEAAPVLAPPG